MSVSIKKRKAIKLDTSNASELHESQRTKSVELLNAISVDTIDGAAVIKDLERQFQTINLELSIQNAKESVINAIVPFGLGSKLSQSDKIGGNVDTIHNVRNGVYATDEEKLKHSERIDQGYDQYAHHAGNNNYNEQKRRGEESASQGTLVDEATGKHFEPNEQGKTDKNLDHVISSHEIWEDPATTLAEQDSTEEANRDSNLKHVNASTNKTKSNDSTEEYLAKRAERLEQKQQRIEKLEAKESLTPQEQNELNNAKKYVEKQGAVDEERMRENDEQARAEREAQLNKDYYASGKFIKSTATAAAKNGVKMGLSAAFATLMSKFFNLSFDEILDVYKNGKETESIFAELKLRLLRVVEQIRQDWKQVMKAFGTGCISGLLTEIVTVLINIFMTTAKRVVTAIREGGKVLLEAILTVLFPPAGVSRAEALDKATKIIVSGVVMVGGLMLEELVEKMILTHLPFLATFANVLSTVITGALVAAVSCLAVYLIDKADLFGVQRDKKHAYVDKVLNDKLEKQIEVANQLAAE